jgi:D-alanine-D-alanine ligase
MRRREYGCLFAEAFVEGPEITVGMLQRGADLITLPILELVPHNEFYDYEAKYTEGMTDFILPARLPEETCREVERYSVDAFNAVGCRGFGRVDFMVGKTDGVAYFTEINTLPGMTDLSDLPAQAREAGISYPELVEIILQTATCGCL